ncbi:MAG: DNA polymerase Y family protein [Roseibium album]|uniref:Y-family DNA polymerase n=1 Tax=Roseibium album TaxID=311410 RepID=UPI0032EB04EE
MLWLGLHFPRLTLEVFEVGAAEAGTPDKQARVVTEAGRIVLCDDNAAAAGIAPGATLATAHSIVPQLAHYPRSPEREQQRLELLAEAGYGFSARVSLAPPAGIVLEIGASLRLFGDAEALEQRVLELCRGMGHSVRARRAVTPLAALILARADADRLDDVRLSQAAVEPERLGADRLERLANMGIHRLGQLLALPRRGLSRRFGADLTDYLDRITGDRPDPRPIIRPAEHFRATLHLLEPLNDKEALAFPMQRLLSDLQHWLVARQLGAERLCWHFKSSAPRERTAMGVRFARARQRRDAFLDITRLKLAETALPEDVIDVTLEARRLVPWSSGSRGLFRDLPPASAETDDVVELVDQFRARLGDGACYSLKSVDQHTPEAAWEPVPPLHRCHPVPARQQAERPLWLFEPPRAVEPEALTLLKGPERIHTGWWLADRCHGEARDYYVARHRSGAECWVFVDPAERWFLHGYFG